MKNLEIERWVAPNGDLPKFPVRPDQRRSPPFVVAQVGHAYHNDEHGAIVKPNGKCATLKADKT